MDAKKRRYACREVGASGSVEEEEKRKEGEKEKKKEEKEKKKKGEEKRKTGGNGDPERRLRPLARKEFRPFNQDAYETITTSR